MSANIEVVRQFFAAINRNDQPAVNALVDPEIVRIEPEGFPTAGTYRGVAEVQAHLAKGRGTWADGTCDRKSCSSVATKSSPTSTSACG